jgi:hypothetical protein
VNGGISQFERGGVGLGGAVEIEDAGEQAAVVGREVLHENAFHVFEISGVLRHIQTAELFNIELLLLLF